ncbi:NACHT domain-containing protein [Streptomyces sp. NPDC002734]|uniref:NACHT domain-containing protein n=1 Tax=Streptomyces sp. NPDC002734 TaxID=3154426 RepID=UPI00331BAAC3
MDRGARHQGLVATVVVDRYRGGAPGVRDRPRLRDTAARFVEQASRLGFRLPHLGIASSDDVHGTESVVGRDRVRTFLERFRRQAADRKILYWTGHGHVHGGTYWLACEDSYQEDGFHPERAVSADELVTWLAEDPTDTLLVFDACFAAEAVEAVVAAAGRRGRARGTDSGLAVVATAGPEQEALEGHWVDCLEQVVSTPELEVQGSLRIFHRESEVVQFSGLMLAVKEMTRDHRPYWQEPVPLPVWFLANPHWSPRARSALRPEEDRAWIGKELAQEELPVFSAAGESWHLRDFTPRHRVLGELVDWLRVQDSGMYTVTGASGSGKSTLLAYLAHLTVAHFVASLPTARRPRALPELRSVNAALHCRGRTLAALCDELARSLEPLGLRTAGLVPGAPHGLVSQVGELVTRVGSLTLLFDGLDEAAAGHSFDIARGLLNPLSALQGVRLVVATRPRARRNLPGDLRSETLLEVLHATAKVELDQAEETEQEITAHVERLLQGDRSPYRRPETERLRETVARHVAFHSNGLFLVATLWARRLTQRPAVRDEAELATELRRGTSVLDFLLDEELVRLDPQDPGRVRDFMRALALAQGVGLPQPRVWLAVTNAVRARGSRLYDEADLRAVIRAADGVTITADNDMGEEVYRLHHPSFGAHLLAEQERHDTWHRAVLDALLPSRSDRWSTTERYVREHIAAHAALAGDDALAALVSDFHFLVAAVPDVLEPLVAARLTTTPQSALYLRVADHFRRYPSDTARWAMLRATALAMFPTEYLRTIPRPASVFWEDVWSSAERLPLHRSWPAPMGGALAVHWEAWGEGIVHASGAGEIRAWTADGHQVRGRDTGAATWTSPPKQRGVTATGRGEGRMIATHDGRCVRVWQGSGRDPVEEFYWGGTPGLVDSVTWGGETLLAAVDGDRLWLWRWDGTGAFSRDGVRTHTVDERVRCVRLLLLGRRVVAVTGGPGGVKVWEVPGPKARNAPLRPARTLGEADGEICAVAAIPARGGDGAVIASLDGHTLRVWRMADPFVGEERLLFGASTAGLSVELGEGPSGLTVAVREGALVRVWEGGGRERVPLPCNHHHRSMAFDPKGSGRLVVADDTRVRVWEPHDPDEEGDAHGLGPLIGRTADRPQARVVAGGRGEPSLLVRSQGSGVLIGLHGPEGQTGDVLRLVHPAQVTALDAVQAGDQWVVAAVGRRRVVLWTLGPRLQLRRTEELLLPVAADMEVCSIALWLTRAGRPCLFWPSRQRAVVWERDDRGAWSEGRSFWMRSAGAVQQLAVVTASDGQAWLTVRGGDAVCVWDLDHTASTPQRVDASGATAVVTGLLKRLGLTVPVIACTNGDSVWFTECDGGYAVATVLPWQDGEPLDGLVLAGPPEGPLLVGWSRKSGGLRIWDVAREEPLTPLQPRGYQVTTVDSVSGEGRVTLMIQGIAQNTVRCDQVSLPWSVAAESATTGEENLL